VKRTPLKRKTTLQQKSPLKRTQIKKVNPKRKKRLYRRNYGERAEVIREMPCVCADSLVYGGRIECSGSIQAAHVKARGMGGCNGDRRSLVPLCAAHHRQQGDIGIESFQKMYFLDLEAKASRIAHEIDLWGIE